MGVRVSADALASTLHEDRVSATSKVWWRYGEAPPVPPRVSYFRWVLKNAVVRFQESLAALGL
jgi:hypothetical protein